MSEQESIQANHNEEVLSDSAILLEANDETLVDASTEEPSPAALNLITDEVEIERALEALIFASPKAISLKRIKSIMTSFSFDTTLVTETLERLIARYQDTGFQLVKVAGSYQFRSHPTQSEILQKLLEDKPVRLSPSALEVLAIIAYKQPVSRSEIDAVRGVDSGHLTRGLLDKNLIRTVGHAETPGRPLLYGTTHYFLEIFSLDSLDALPSLEEFDRELAARNAEQNEEDSDETAGLDASTENLEELAEFHDRNSPLAAEPDRGDFDNHSEEEEEKPDFGVNERAMEGEV